MSTIITNDEYAAAEDTPKKILSSRVAGFTLSARLTGAGEEVSAML